MLREAPGTGRGASRTLDQARSLSETSKKAVFWLRLVDAMVKVNPILVVVVVVVLVVAVGVAVVTVG